MADSVHQTVQDYYGKELQSTQDLKTNACCTSDGSVPPQILDAESQVHSVVKSKFYGCGITIPSSIQGLRILDLGSGSGKDCYIASKLVGEDGSVVGVDMTDEQLDVANEYIDYHREKFGYAKSNVSFVKGNIDQLDQLGFESDSFDVIISNCVINLTMNKGKVLKDTYNLLKNGGEMYFSDVYSDRRIPEDLKNDPILWGECLSGALYWNDFLRYAKEAGFTDPRAVTSRRITVGNSEIQQRVGDIKFYSVTYRLFKLEGLESSCEDYGQKVMYKGTIGGEEESFKLDDHHIFNKDEWVAVCGNTYKMLHDTRFKDHFKFCGNWSTHFGIFEGCGQAMPFKEKVCFPTKKATSSCC